MDELISAESFTSGLRWAPEQWSAATGRPVVIVDTADPGVDLDARPGNTAVVIVAFGPQPGPAWADLVVSDEGTLEAIIASIEANPIAAVSLAVLLRSAGTGSAAEGLARESAVYSLLQAGPEFRGWRERTPARPAQTVDEPVRWRRDGDDLIVTLNRPRRHNAIDPELRDGLCDALTLADLDDEITRVVLRGNGPSFCSGGDLDTFGSFADPASAHLVRLTRSPAMLCARLAARLEAHLHGSCLGGGIELAAFARRVVAAPGARFGLPEVGFGLIPGAGGTVSLPARIGRRRTLELALCGTTIDATTALAWGLIDEIVDELPVGEG